MTFRGKDNYHFLIMRTRNITCIYIVIVLQNNNTNALLFCKVFCNIINDTLYYIIDMSHDLLQPEGCSINRIENGQHITSHFH